MGPDEDAVKADKHASLSAQAVDADVPRTIELWLALTTKLWGNVSSFTCRKKSKNIFLRVVDSKSASFTRLWHKLFPLLPEPLMVSESFLPLYFSFSPCPIVPPMWHDGGFLDSHSTQQRTALAPAAKTPYLRLAACWQDAGWGAAEVKGYRMRWDKAWWTSCFHIGKAPVILEF